jgi:Asp/Glu/hydantoin racemase
LSALAADLDTSLILLCVADVYVQAVHMGCATLSALAADLDTSLIILCVADVYVQVVHMGCATLSALAADLDTALRLIKAKVMPSLYQLMGHNQDSAKEAALQVC